MMFVFFSMHDDICVVIFQIHEAFLGKQNSRSLLFNSSQVLKIVALLMLQWRHLLSQHLLIINFK